LEAKGKLEIVQATNIVLGGSKYLKYRTNYSSAFKKKSME
jgi:hypothetical protein